MIYKGRRKTRRSNNRYYPRNGGRGHCQRDLRTRNIRPEHLRPEQKTKYHVGHLQRSPLSGSQKTEPSLKHQKLEERYQEEEEPVKNWIHQSYHASKTYTGRKKEGKYPQAFFPMHQNHVVQVFRNAKTLKLLWRSSRYYHQQILLELIQPLSRRRTKENRSDLYIYFTLLSCAVEQSQQTSILQVQHHSQRSYCTTSKQSPPPCHLHLLSSLP